MKILKTFEAFVQAQDKGEIYQPEVVKDKEEDNDIENDNIKSDKKQKITNTK